MTKRLRLTVRMAAETLGVSLRTIRGYVSQDLFSAIRPDGYGRGKRLYLFADEIELYGETGRWDAVRKLRTEKKRLNSTPARPGNLVG